MCEGFFCHNFIKKQSAGKKSYLDLFWIGVQKSWMMCKSDRYPVGPLQDLLWAMALGKCNLPTAWKTPQRLYLRNTVKLYFYGCGWQRVNNLNLDARNMFGTSLGPPFTLWWGTMTIQIFRTLKIHPKILPWKLRYHLCRVVNCNVMRK